MLRIHAANMELNLYMIAARQACLKSVFDNGMVICIMKHILTNHPIYYPVRIYYSASLRKCEAISFADITFVFLSSPSEQRFTPLLKRDKARE